MKFLILLQVFFSNQDVPSNIKVGVPFVCKYIIQNLTLHLADIIVYSQSSEHFASSGMKQSQLRVLPLSTHILSFNILPITSGKCALPQLKIIKKTDIENTESEDAISKAMVAMPPGKLFAIHGPSTLVSTSKEFSVHVEPNSNW